MYEIAQFPSQGQNQWNYQSRKMSQNLGTKYSGKIRFNLNEKLTLQTVSLTSSNWKIMPVRKHHTKDTDGRESVSIAYLKKLTCKSILSATLISFEFAILGRVVSSVSNAVKLFCYTEVVKWEHPNIWKCDRVHADMIFIIGLYPAIGLFFVIINGLK